MSDNLKYLNEANKILEEYETQIKQINGTNTINNLQNIIKKIDTLLGKIENDVIKKRLNQIKDNATEIINGIKESQTIEEEVARNMRLVDLRGRSSLLYSRQLSVIVYEKLIQRQSVYDYYSDLTQATKQLRILVNELKLTDKPLILEKLKALAEDACESNAIDATIPRLRPELRGFNKEKFYKTVYKYASENAAKNIQLLIEFINNSGYGVKQTSLQVQNKLKILKEKGAKLTKKLEELNSKKEQSENQTVKKELNKIITQEENKNNTTNSKITEQQNKINKLPGGDKNAFEAFKTPIIKKAQETEQVIATQLEQITPPISVSDTKALSGQNPLSDLFGETQLLEGDILDPRKIDLFIPGYYTDKLPAYMSIIYTGESPLTNTGVSTNLPTLEAPFQAGNQKKVYNQFFLTRTYESYNEKQQLVDTMSEGNVAFFFGRAPEIWTFSGQLINDKLHAWHAKMREIWHTTLRGSILAKQNAFLSIVVPSNMLQVNCYPISLNMEHNTSSEHLSMFSMSVIIKNSRTLPGLVSRNTAKGNTEKLSPFETMIKIAEFLNKMQKGAV